MLPIYLDYNATTPIDPEVAAAMLPFMVNAFGNPSSTHWYGLQGRRAVEEARAQVAALLGCHPDEILFTSGGSEANNLALKGFSLAHREQGNHLIVSAVEHPAVMEVARHLVSRGFELTILPVDGYGMVSPADVAAALRPDTLLVSVMHANNEVGTIEPIA
ncbi:MAG TPA: aminotransferase class V-fold PLP-dependent enzyme, partial [bacterium]|nr:aminotransferase class V-fold PLP-dependent enzyme [bacterium]